MTAGPDTGVGGLVGVVQRFGLFSATSIVDRYAEIVDRAIAGDPGPAFGESRRDLPADLADAWMRLLDAATARLRDDAPQPPWAGTLVLPPTRPGRDSEAALWVHNTTSSPADGVTLRVTALLSAVGGSIPSAAVSLVPDHVDRVAAGASREVRLRVRVPAGQPAASYHGMVLTSAAPAEPLPVRLEVRGPDGTRP